MTDRRTLPANGRVAASSLRGQIEADTFVDGRPARVSVAVCDLKLDPDMAGRDRQLILGDVVTVFEELDDLAFVQSVKDGHVGYVRSLFLNPDFQPTHQVSVRSSHLYRSPDIKGAVASDISFGSSIRIVGGHGPMYETHDGHFVPRAHLRPANAAMTDHATVAQVFFGTPYLWGGNSHRGIDCSGLVQASLLACGLHCPADSDQQQVTLGTELPSDTALKRGDFVFWNGHVAIAVDDATLIHANAHHMAVVYETFAEARDRIEKAGDGPVTSRRRL